MWSQKVQSLAIGWVSLRCQSTVKVHREPKQWKWSEWHFLLASWVGTRPTIGCAFSHKFPNSLSLKGDASLTGAQFCPSKIIYPCQIPNAVRIQISFLTREQSFLRIAATCHGIARRSFLVGGWTNPFEKICPWNWIISPGIGVKIKHTPPSCESVLGIT